MSYGEALLAVFVSGPKPETAGDYVAPREVIRLMVSLLFINDDKLLATPWNGAQDDSLLGEASAPQQILKASIAAQVIPFRIHHQKSHLYVSLF